MAVSEEELQGNNCIDPATTSKIKITKVIHTHTDVHRKSRNQKPIMHSQVGLYILNHNVTYPW